MSREEMSQVYQTGHLKLALSTEDMPEGKRILTWGKFEGYLFQDVFRSYPVYIRWVLAYMPAKMKEGSNLELFVRLIYNRSEDMKAMQDRQASSLPMPTVMKPNLEISPDRLHVEPIRKPTGWFKLPEAVVTEDKESNLRAEVQELKAQVTSLSQKVAILEAFELCSV